MSDEFDLVGFSKNFISYPMRDKLNSAWKWKPIKENDDFDLGDMGDLDGEFDLGDMDLGDDLDLDNDLLGKLFHAKGFTAIYSIDMPWKCINNPT